MLLSESDPRYVFREAAELLLKMEALLKSHGIVIGPGSGLENIGLNVLELLFPDGIVLPTNWDPRKPFLELIGVAEFARVLLAASSHPEFPNLLAHLRLINTAYTVQNVHSPSTDQATNKLFELFVAASILPCGKDLTLDPPDTSIGDNPDILLTIGGERCGIACKTVHADKPKTLWGNIAKGAEQIDASPATVGVVLVNMKNVVAQDPYWWITNPNEVQAGADPTFSCFNRWWRPFSILENELAGRVATLSSSTDVGTATLERKFSGSRAVAFGLWGHTGAATLQNGVPTPTSVRRLHMELMRDASEELLLAFECFNRGLYGMEPAA